MRIISEKRLREFWQAATGAEAKRREKAMREWMTLVKPADWNNFADVRQTFNHADVYKNCLIFDVGGNKYRVIAKPGYRVKILFIRFVLTHKEYDDKKWQCECD